LGEQEFKFKSEMEHMEKDLKIFEYQWPDFG